MVTVYWGDVAGGSSEACGTQLFMQPLYVCFFR